MECGGSGGRLGGATQNPTRPADAPGMVRQVSSSTLDPLASAGVPRGTGVGADEPPEPSELVQAARLNQAVGDVAHARRGARRGARNDAGARGEHAVEHAVELG